MTLLRMDNVGIVVEDLEAAIAFFAEIGLELEGRAEIEGDWAATAVGVPGLRCEIAMLRTPDGHGRLELSHYLAPEAITLAPSPIPPNTIGLHRVMLTVTDIDDTLARLRPLGGEVLDQVARYEDAYRLCYLRGPSGTIVALAEELDAASVSR